MTPSALVPPLYVFFFFLELVMTYFKFVVDPRMYYDQELNLYV